LKEKEFKALSKAQQIEFISVHGKLVNHRHYLNFRIELYAIPYLFVEKWYHLSLGGVYYVEIQKNKEILLEYVTEITIQNYFNK